MTLSISTYRLVCLFINHTSTTEIYTLSLHDALPISKADPQRRDVRALDLPHPGDEVGHGGLVGGAQAERGLEDRKSTRLNSSHSQISYAVFCLKKKRKTIDIIFLYLI